ncbi:hypothetical protein V6N13_060810 [Hibiscus sabdariffa]|uniref:Uncharacterized protein n=1 Tax=Hibiscus sabdariffa TaxID=183260 RepID=A0ABR2P7D4_9ROSI
MLVILLVLRNRPEPIPHRSDDDMYGPWMQVESRRRRQSTSSKVGNRDKIDPTSSRGSRFAILSAVEAEGSRPRVLENGTQAGLSVGV